MADRKLIVELVGDERDLLRAYGRAGRATDTFGTKVSRSLGNIAKAGVFAGVTAGVVGVTVALRAGISEFAESARVQAQTRAALKSTGGVANVTARQIDRLSTALMNQSGVDDELVQTGANLLLTFKNVRNEVGRGNDVFTRATRSALDLSQAGFGSVETASKMLGKALNDPVRGMTALGRAGVTFSKVQKETIKALVETGRTLEAQKLILAEVESQVGGSAKAYGQTLPGMLKILRENFNNVAGDIVRNYAPAFKNAVREATKWIQNAENQRRVLDTVRDIVSKVKAVIEALIPVVRGAATVAEKFADAMGGAKNAVAALALAITGLKVRALITGLNMTGAAAAGAATQVGILRTRLRALGSIVVPAIAIPIVLDLAKDARESGRAPKPRGPVGEFINKIPGFKTVNEAVAGLALEITDALGLTSREVQKKITDDLRSRTHLRIDPVTGAVTEWVLGTAGKPGKAGKATVPETVKKKAKQAGHGIGLVSGSAMVAGAFDGWREAMIPDRVRGSSAARGAFAAFQKAFVAPLVSGTARFPGLIQGRDQRRQFRALGLTSLGEALAPTRQALIAETKKITAGLSGTLLDTDANRNLLGRIRRVLALQFGALTRETRLKVKELLDALTGGEAKGTSLTPFRAASSKHLTEGLGLSRSQRAAFRQRIAGAGLLMGASPGGGPVMRGQNFAAASAGLNTVHIETVHVHGVKNVDDLIRQIKRKASHGAAQTRGRHGGHTLGLT